MDRIVSVVSRSTESASIPVGVPFVLLADFVARLAIEVGEARSLELLIEASEARGVTLDQTTETWRWTSDLKDRLPG